jgi:hypothetical protein
VAMLIGAAGAVVVVLAIDALPHTGNSRRRAALLRVARDATGGMSAPARPLSRARLPRALARQSRRGGRLPRLGRERTTSPGLHSQANRLLRVDVGTSRPTVVAAGRDELAHGEVAASSGVPTRPRPEEFGFER